MLDSPGERNRQKYLGRQCFGSSGKVCKSLFARAQELKKLMERNPTWLPLILSTHHAGNQMCAIFPIPQHLRRMNQVFPSEACLPMEVASFFVKETDIYFPTQRVRF